MTQGRSAARWDREFGAGKYAYLHKPAETARLAEIAAMVARSIAENGPCEVVDIGCGEGLLLERLAGLAISRYVGVDISAVALSRLPASAIPVTRVRRALARWDGGPAPEGRRVIVASEVLYYDAQGVAQLQRVAAAGGVAEIIVSCVGGRADKPNWTAASQRLWAQLAATGWRLVERRYLADRASGTGWDLARYAV